MSLFVFGWVAFTPFLRTCNAHPPLPRLLLNPCTSDNAHCEAPPLVAQLPEGRATLHSLFTFIFPVTPPIPSNAEKVMELGTKWPLCRPKSSPSLHIRTHCLPTGMLHSAFIPLHKSTVFTEKLFRPHKLSQNAQWASRGPKVWVCAYKFGMFGLICPCRAGL